MQGVTLLAGLALLGSLAVPAGLLASEQAPAPAGDPAAAEAVPGQAAPVAPEGELEAAQPAYDQQAAPDPDARTAATRTVAMRDNFFKPKRITIDPGDTVQWENRGEVEHNAIGENGSFDTPTIDPGQTSSHTFNRKRKFPYFCSIHAGMTGTIQVGASSSGGGGGGGGDGGTGDGSGTGGVGAEGSDPSTGSTGSGSTGSFGSSGSSGTSSSLASTGSELLWLGLIGYGLLAFGAFVRLAAIGR